MAKAKKPTKKSQAWPLFDAIVDRAPLKDTNPWRADGVFEPDYDTLCRLLAVPLSLKANTQSGVPALAFDVWVAYELRRAHLEPDTVWPRAEAPRVVSRDVLNFIASVKPAKAREALVARLKDGTTNGRTTGASANLLGKNYTKQVDVVVSAWGTGPEVLIWRFGVAGGVAAQAGFAGEGLGARRIGVPTHLRLRSPRGDRRYAHVRPVGRLARRERARGRRRRPEHSVAGTCGDHHRAGRLRRLRDTGKGEGPPHGRAGGPARVRAPRGSGVAQAPLVLPRR